MEQFLTSIEELSKIGFHSTKLKDLYSSHSLTELLELLRYAEKNKDQLKKVLDYFDALFSDSTIYKELLLSENSFDFVQALLSHENKKVRSLLSSCIEYHDFEFGALISQLVEEKSKTLTLVLQVLFFQLSDPESEVGLKALRVVKKVFNSVVLLSSEIFATYLGQGLNSKNEVVQLRYVEVLIYLTNLDERVQKAHIQLFPIVFKLYNTNDILVKLNMIELIAGMGNSKWNAELMINQPFFKNILNTAFTNNDDFYTQKYEVLLVVRMLSQRVVKITPLIEKNVMKLLQNWLSTNSTEEIEGALEVISSYVKFTEGFNAIIKNSDFVGLFLKYIYSTKETIKYKACNAYISFFEQDSITPKPPGKIVWLYSLFGNPLKTISQFQTNEQVCEATTYLIKQLNSPFGEVEKTMLDLLGGICNRYSSIIKLGRNILKYYSQLAIVNIFFKNIIEQRDL